MLVVGWCGYKAAKYAVENWHYSGRIVRVPVACLGAWEDGKFIGAIVFGGGANPHIGRPFGVGNNEACELVRVALTDHRAPTSQIVTLAVKKFRSKFPQYKLIVSYADPWEGHVGGIYQAMNWFFIGQSAPDRYPLVRGRVVHPRSLSDLVKAGKADRSKTSYVRRPGKLKYVLALDPAVLPRIQKMSLPYPKK